MVLEDAIQEEEGEIGGSKGFDSGDEMGCSCESIANNPNRIAAVRHWQFDNEIHRDGLPGTIRDFKGLEKSVGFVSQCLYERADLTCLNVPADKSTETWP